MLAKKQDKRKNAVFQRQGEWFFVPFNKPLKPSDVEIHRNEPLQRGPTSTPHICDELYRRGGRQVYIVGRRVLSEAQYLEEKKRNPNFDGRRARIMTANAIVFVRGHVRHRDHKTVYLDGWHRAYINGEVRNTTVRFLD